MSFEMNSALNPEAPEFYPHLNVVTKGGYTTVTKTVKSSNQLPSRASYEVFKKIPDFKVVTRQLSENVIVQSNQIIITELPAVKFKCNDNEYNTDKMIDANDSMLDRLNMKIDVVKAGQEPSDKVSNNHKPSISVSSWNKTQAPVIAKIQVGSTTFIGAKNIPRPQLTFKDPVDNSDNMWVPKISDKPNNIKPLALNILYNDEGVAIGYEHPYQMELDLYQPPARFVEPDPSPPPFPPPLNETSYTYVDTEAQVDELVKHLTDVQELAVDLEHHSYRTYQGITCLIQISTNEGGDFIIDALAVREHIHKLNLIFTDPKKIKVFHGAQSDVLWLQRDFGVYMVGLFDTYQAAKALNLTGLSLKYLLIKYCQVDSDKRYQLADWRIRPLPDELVEYARMDTHYLLYIWRKMKAELIEIGTGQTHLLMSVFEQSRQVCGTTYNKEVIHDKSHMPLYVRSKKCFNTQQMAALKLLYKWRDEQAREHDESTTYLLPNHMLLSLAENLPREVQGVNACCSPMPPFVKQNLIMLHRMLLTCRELPMEPQLFRMPNAIRSMANEAHRLTYHVHDLSQIPDFREDNRIDLNRAVTILEQSTDFQPDVTIFVPTYNSENNTGFVSELNADAKLFIPPYDRYRKYRTLAQMEELKEFREKEAKIAAIAKGNQLIKNEVLVKVQQAKSQAEQEDEQIAIEIKDLETSIKKGEKRKRKMSSEKIKRKETPPAPPQIIETKDPKLDNKNANKNKKSETNKNMKPYQYKNVNYRNFFDDSDKKSQPKMKFKKRK